MSDRNQMQQRFGEFTIDLARRRLLKGETCVPLTAKAFETLCVLLAKSGKTVSKSDLMDAVWGETAVEENNLTQQISALRKALGERPNDHRFIVTVPGRGYSFVAEIDRAAPASQRSAAWTRYIDDGARRGYVVAAAYILLVCFSFVFQGSRPARPQSLAVANFGAESANDKFIGTGISDTLRARLGSVEDIVVKPSPADIDQDVITLGRDLDVDAVVVGSVQRDHGRIRVAVQMVDVDAGRIIWGKTFDEPDADVFALQDSIAGEVARVLNIPA
jgi:serine/threonine-protein kinase